MQPLPPAGGTATGRFVAVIVGLALGTATTLYLLRDYELVKRLDDPKSEKLRPFRVRFTPSEPLRLKPEAQARLVREAEARAAADPRGGASSAEGTDKS